MSHRHRVSVAVLGVPFDNITMHEAVELIEQQIEERGFHQVATANLDFLIHAIHDRSLQDVSVPATWSSPTECRLYGLRVSWEPS